MPNGAEIVQTSLLKWLDEQDKARSENYQKLEDYYDGKGDVPIPGNILDVIGANAAYKANICKAAVDAAVRFIAKAQPVVEVKLPAGYSEEKAKATKEAAEKWFESILTKSGFKVRNFLAALRTQGKKGEFALKVAPIYGAGDNVEGYEILFVRPDICYPKWSMRRLGEMQEFVTKYAVRNAETGKMDIVIERITPNAIEHYIQRGGENTLRPDDSQQNGNNNYGFIPVHWVVNVADDTNESESDISEDLMRLQDGLNMTITDMFYASNADSFKEVYIIGANQPVDPRTNKPIELKRKPGILRFLSPSMGGQLPQVKSIEAANFEGIMRVIDQTLDLVSIITSTPKNELNRSSDGQVPTGIALKVLYQAFLNKCAEKVALLAEGLQKSLIDAYKMALVDKVQLPFEAVEGLEVVVNINPTLPVDDKEQSEIQSNQIKDGTLSKRTAMKRNRITDVEEEEKQINAEKATDQKMQLDIYQMRTYAELQDNSNKD